MNTIIEQQLSQASFEVFEEFQARIEKENISKNLNADIALRTDPDIVVKKMAYYIHYETEYDNQFAEDCHKTRRQISRVATALGEMMANNDFLDTEFEETV